MHTAVMDQRPHLVFSPNPDDTKKQKIIFIYFQTFENRSSLPPNPPFEGLLPVMVVVGAALAQPPKSSSAATVGAAVAARAVAGAGAGLDAFGDAPQPAPMSLEVRVSGIFMVLDDEGAGAAGGVGVGSGLLQALPPHGSMLADENMLVKFEDVDVVGAALGAGWWELLVDRLNTEFRFGAACGGTGFGRGGDVDFVADGAVRSNKSLENDGAGGFGCDKGEEGFF
jgi:hypothetical protein